ncbi:MAG: ABC transporter substrate-binding protein [Candidatus Tectomicrobia bacterium]|nr:ABC transporter substrate-binding protein [Candidatus Tectomicrobia bacterium]
MSSPPRAMRFLPPLAALLLVGSLTLLGPGAPPGWAADPILIGEINSYSGVASAFTAPYREAIKMAVEEINARGGALGRPIEVLFRDDKLRPDEGIKHAQELVVQRQVAILAGTFSSAVGLAVSEFARRAKKLFVAAEPLTDVLTWQKGHRYVFRVRPNTYEQGRMLAERAAKLPHRRYAVIGPNYEYGRKAWEGFWNRLRELKPGVEMVAEYWPKLGEGEYSSYITGILNAKPEVVYTSLFGSDWIAFVKQASPFGLFQRAFVIGILLGEPEYIEPLGMSAPEGMLVTGYPWYAIDTPAHTDFVKRYRERTGTPPRQGSLVGYITLLSIAAAIDRAGSLETEKLVTAMEDLEVSTPIGPIRYRGFDHQSTMGAWIGTTKRDPQRGFGIMIDWRYVPGEEVLPGKEEVEKMRQAGQ